MNNKYKTMICRYWDSGNPCPLKQNCHYAHGFDELRKPSDVSLTSHYHQLSTKNQKNNSPNTRTITIKQYHASTSPWVNITRLM
jgi:hypothetical protein